MQVLIQLIKLILLLAVVSYMIVLTWVALDKHQEPICQQSDAIIVLGAAAWGNTPSPVLKHRIEQAIVLYQQGLAHHIIFTGGSAKKSDLPEAKVAANWAIQHHIPAKAIDIDPISRNTYYNLLNAKRIGEDKGFKRFIIVSDGYHLSRALFVAWLLGIEAQASAVVSSKKINSKRMFTTYLKETNLIFSTLLYHVYRKLTYLYYSF